MTPRAKQRHWEGAPAARPVRRKFSAFVPLALMLFGAGSGMSDAYAQAQSAAKPGGTGNGKPTVDLRPPQTGAQSEESLSPEEMQAKAKQFVTNIEQASQSMSRQLQAARKERDVVRVLCLNDKLNQVDVALSSARDRQDAVRSAAEQGDVDRTRHEYTVLAVLNDRVRVLVNESAQCVGEETGFIGDAEVSVSVDPNLPETGTSFESNSNTPPPPPNITSPIE